MRPFKKSGANTRLVEILSTCCTNRECYIFGSSRAISQKAGALCVCFVQAFPRDTTCLKYVRILESATPLRVVALVVVDDDVGVRDRVTRDEVRAPALDASELFEVLACPKFLSKCGRAFKRR